MYIKMTEEGRKENSRVPTAKASVSRRGSMSSCEGLTKEELIVKVKEYRKDNIELLEDKRHLLLRSQEALKMETKLKKTEDEVEELRERVKVLEKNSPNDITTNAINEIVQQLSSSSKVSSEEQTLQENDILFDFKQEKEEEIESSFDSEKQKQKLKNKEENIEEVFHQEEEQDTTVDRLQQKQQQQQKQQKQGQSRTETKEAMLDDKLTCTCGLKDKYFELIKINHLWQKDYSKLQEETNRVKARLWKAESESKLAKDENDELQKKIVEYVAKEEEEQHCNVNGTLIQSENYTRQQNGMLHSADDIEALKQQLLIYKEDYDAEKEDNKKLVDQSNKIKLELQKAYGMIDSLTLKHNRVKENYRRVSHEKDHIINELRRLSTSTLPFSPAAVDHNVQTAAGFRNIIPESASRLDDIRIRRSESDESLNSDEDLPRRGRMTRVHIPPSNRDRIERDGVTTTTTTLNRKTSSPTPIKGRQSPPLIINGCNSPSRLSPRGLAPGEHIDFKVLTNVTEDQDLRSL